MRHHGLPFEIGDHVRVSPTSGAGIPKRAESIKVVGLDLWGEHDRTVKVGWFVRGSGVCSQWFNPGHLSKISAVDQLAEIVE